MCTNPLLGRYIYKIYYAVFQKKCKTVRLIYKASAGSELQRLTS